MQPPFKLLLPHQGRNHALPIGADEVALVASYVMDMYLVKAQIEKALDVLTMLLKVGRDEHASLEILGAYQLGNLGEVFRRANVLFGGSNAAVGPLFHGLLFRFFASCSPGDVQLQQLGHAAGLFACLASTFLEALNQHLQLLTGRGGSDEAIAHTPGRLGCLWPGGGNINRAGYFRPRIETCALHLEMLAGVTHLFAGEELFYDFDRFNHPLEAHGGVRPFTADNVFIERLTRANAQPVSSGIHRRERGGSLRDDRRVVTIRGTGDAWPKSEPLRAHPERTHPGPYQGTLTLLWHPRVKVVGGHHTAKSRLFSFLAPAYQVGRVKLLESCRVTNYRHLRNSFLM